MSIDMRALTGDEKFTKITAFDVLTVEDELLTLFRQMDGRQKFRLLQKANFLVSPVGTAILKNQPGWGSL